MFDYENLIDKIALGTVQFGLNYGISNKVGKTSLQEVSEILSFCRNKGIMTLDTAYGYGESETTLGKNNLDGFKIVSKFLDPKSVNNLSLEQQLNKSLSRLNLKSVYAYLAHRTLATTVHDWETLLKLKENGIIKKIGFSFNELDEFNFIIKKGFIPDLVQAPYNFLDRRFTTILSELKSKYNTEIHTRSVFLQGLFFMNPINLPDFFNPIKELLIVIERTNYKAGALLKYVLNQPFIDKVVIGVNNKTQLEHNLIEFKIAESLSKNLIGAIPVECIMPSKWPVL